MHLQFISNVNGSFDKILRGGTVFDGTGNPSQKLDVGIINDKIVSIGDLSSASAHEILDVTGLYVVPGFINMLSWSVSSLIKDGRALGGITQGVTLEIMGEGWSMGPLNEKMIKPYLSFFEFDFDSFPWETLGEYLEYLEDKGVSPNIASFIGATTLRMHEIGEENRPPTHEELDNMKELVDQAMKEGAMGIASSLIYPPAFFASTKELIEICKIASKHGGRYISHMRSEGNKLEEAVDELITIAREAEIGAEIYHLKQGGKQNWHKLDKVIKQIDTARGEGLDITTDMYLYTAGGTGLDACLPPWVQDGGIETMLEMLRDEEKRAELKVEMNKDSDDWENFFFSAGPENILLSYFKKEEMYHYIGKTIKQIAEELGKGYEDTIFDILLKAGSRVGAIYFLMSEDNVRKQIKLPYMAFGSDAGSIAPEGEFLQMSPHPRAYGNVPKLLGKYVRDEKLISWEEAIYKLTGLPATNLKIKKRGFLKEGYFADITVFDPNLIQDKATYEEPHQLSEGVIHVFVNGEQVLKNGEHTGKLPGRVVRGPGYVQ